MAVREIATAGDHIFLGGGGSALSGWGMMFLARLLTLTGSHPVVAATNTASTQGTWYYDATNEVSYGSAVGDVTTTSFTLNTTDWWLLGFTKAAGGTPVAFHARNITTLGAAQHFTTAGTVADGGLAWNRTEIGSADGGGFQGNCRIATAAIFATAYSSGNFDAVTSGTAQILALSPTRAWDFNQASTATAVVNLITGTADQTAIVGTTAIADGVDDPPGWAFASGASVSVSAPALRRFPLGV